MLTEQEKDIINKTCLHEEERDNKLRQSLSKMFKVHPELLNMFNEMKPNEACNLQH